MEMTIPLTKPKPSVAKPAGRQPSETPRSAVVGRALTSRPVESESEDESDDDPDPAGLAINASTLSSIESFAVNPDANPRSKPRTMTIIDMD